MQISPIISFKGVEIIGTLDKNSSIKEYQNLINKAESRAEELKNSGRDTFVTNYFAAENGNQICILTDATAKTINKFNEISKELCKSFNIGGASDRFIIALDKQLDAIKQTQNDVAIFLAKNINS